MRSSGFVRILVATLIAGIGGYAITWLAARALGPAPYADFAAFWSFLYLVVGALAGMQQEAARAAAFTSHEPPSARPAHVMRFAAALGLVTFLVVGIVALLLSQRLFASSGLELAIPLACGTAVNALVSASLGLLYGVELWRPLSLVLVADVVFRLAGFLTVLSFGGGVGALAWASVIPYPLTIVLLWVVVRGPLHRAQALNIGYGQLTWNTARTIGAAAATAVLVSGFPVVLTSVSGDSSRAVLGVLILAITLTRAPLVVSSLALQSYLVVFFKARAQRLFRLVATVSAAVVLLTAVLSVAVGLVGPVLLQALFGAGYRVDGVFLGLLTASSAPTALLAITGAAVLSRSRHTLYVTGWVVGAGAALALLGLPLPLDARAVVALAAGPLLGALVHVAGAVRARQRVIG